MAAAQPCTPYCPGVTGFPDLECTHCQSLFHSKCVGIHQVVLEKIRKTFRCRVSLIIIILISPQKVIKLCLKTMPGIPINYLDMFLFRKSEKLRTFITKIFSKNCFYYRFVHRFYLVVEDVLQHPQQSQLLTSTRIKRI